MTVVISDSLVLGGGGVDADANADNPIIGYHNLVTTANISATTEDPNFPVVNLANPSTAQLWSGIAGSPSGDEEYITIVLNTVEQVDYVAVARHNFGSGRFPVSIEGLADSAGSPLDWFELVADVLLPNDGPVIFRFTPQSLYAVRIRLQPPQDPEIPDPYAAVVYVGLLLVLQRRIYVGHTPIPYGRSTKVVNARSESGNFLGRIVLGSMTRSQIDMKHITPGWYRQYLDPFVVSAVEDPFFFSWRPFTYPYEGGYAWLVNDAVPQNQLANGMMEIKMELAGIV